MGDIESTYRVKQIKKNAEVSLRIAGDDLQIQLAFDSTWEIHIFRLRMIGGSGENKTRLRYLHTVIRLDCSHDF